MLQQLTYAEIAGIGGAAGLGVDAFRKACEAVGLIEAATGEVQPPAPAPAAAKTRAAPAPAAETKQSAATPAPAPAKAAESTGGEMTDEEIARAEAAERASQQQEAPQTAQGGAKPAARRGRIHMPDMP